MEFLKVLCASWNGNADAIEALARRPSISVGPQTVQIGHVVLDREPGCATAAASCQAPFSRTSVAQATLFAVAEGVANGENVLLVGETGTGKTTTVQYVAGLLGKQLLVQNLSQQSDSTDIFGGFKPIEMSQMCSPLLTRFDRAFPKTVSASKNRAFVEKVRQAFADKDWNTFILLLEKACRLARTRCANPANAISAEVRGEWDKLCGVVTKLANRIRRGERIDHSFAFVEGALIKAVKEGHWILLDEFNLASTETLEGLSGLLEGNSVTVSELGDIKPIERHPGFRLFCCMNPPTDVGKKDLPPGLRNRFTEIYVDEVSSKEDISVVVKDYLGGVVSVVPVDRVADFARTALLLSKRGEFVDNSGLKTHISLRTLTRALASVRLLAPTFGFARALVEGFMMSYLTQLNQASYRKMRALIVARLLPEGMSEKKFFVLPACPATGKYVKFHNYWIEQGTVEPFTPASYVLTPSIEGHLNSIARAVVSGHHPVLLQGPTSAGKTAMVQYLASITGHKLVRINNHEHTDIQEYLGNYVSDHTGKLVFHEGILVEAVRNGYWVVLDELNLAPSDVLEALNRLLDTNRELYIAETQVTVRPHPSFMLFATQNPPGTYGGRKTLSRAFRNRFVELHVDDIPEAELKTIVEKRCKVPPSRAQLLVTILKRLQRARGVSNVFGGKNAFITLRDLFRWSSRSCDDLQTMAEEGYCLLAERLRNDQDKQIIKTTIEEVFKAKIDIEAVYEAARETPEFRSIATVEDETVRGIVWTHGMLRLFALVLKCIKHHEPVLLVGDTGCGKTTICQVLAKILGQTLRIVNCHQNTETSDFIGGLRPVRGNQTLKVLFARYFAAANVHLDEPVLDVDELSAEELYKEFCKAKGVIAKKIVALRHPSPDEAGAGGEVEKSSDGAGKNADAKRNGKGKKRRRSADVDRQRQQKLAALEDDARQLDRLGEEIENEHSIYLSHFHWKDGPLTEAMRSGDLLLIDEISLAEDAVLERLNSVLEVPSVLVLAEKSTDTMALALESTLGIMQTVAGAEGEEGAKEAKRQRQERLASSIAESLEVSAADTFRIFGTMNPGGDFGKKELSPALRNRFTEIYVSAADTASEMGVIIESKLETPALKRFVQPMLEFVEWFRQKLSGRVAISVRDLLCWTSFMNLVAGREASCNTRLAPATAFVQGACLTFVDALGTSYTMVNEFKVAKLKEECFAKLTESLSAEEKRCAAASLENTRLSLHADAPLLTFGDFTIERGTAPTPTLPFTFEARTTAKNAIRVCRALQLKKSILLEGYPGVGKTALIQALAAIAGHGFVRINLSEQSDISDLLGADLPADEHEGGRDAKDSIIAWRDGPFLRAIKEGSWVLLDELNLAPQSVLEGLNSILDHRGEVFIPELGITVKCPPSFRVFACQNPLQQGGGRKGLPKSFLNRFTQVYVDPLMREDLEFILTRLHPTLDAGFIGELVRFVVALHEKTEIRREFALRGAPWEWNLRDLDRLCKVALASRASRASLSAKAKADLVELIFAKRLRTEEDRQRLRALFRDVTGILPEPELHPGYVFAPACLQVGRGYLARRGTDEVDPFMLQHEASEWVVCQSTKCVFQDLLEMLPRTKLLILVGPSCSGKTTAVKQLAALAGVRLHVFTTTSSSDTTDFIGGFEQADASRAVQRFKRALARVERILIRYAMGDAEQRLLSVDGERCGSGAAAPCDGTAMCVEAEQGSAAHRGGEAKKGGAERSGGVKEGRKNELLELLSQFCSAELEAVKEFSGVKEVDAVTMAQMKKLVGLADSFAEIAPQAGLSTAECYGDLHQSYDSIVMHANNSLVGKFEWNEGLMVEAMRKGDWVLVDNVNFCSAAVLDRLNPLFDSDDGFAITERGIVNGEIVTVQPHANFRIFFTLDPAHGEISRAMRNRGYELFLPEISPFSDDAAAMLRAKGFVDLRVAKGVQQLFRELCSRCVLFTPSLKSLLLFGKLAITEIEVGSSAQRALTTAALQVFGAELDSQTVADVIKNSAATVLHTEGTSTVAPVVLFRDYMNGPLMATLFKQAEVFYAFVDSPERLPYALGCFFANRTCGDTARRAELLRLIASKLAIGQSDGVKTAVATFARIYDKLDRSALTARLTAGLTQLFSELRLPYECLEFLPLDLSCNKSFKQIIKNKLLTERHRELWAEYKCLVRMQRIATALELYRETFLRDGMKDRALRLLSDDKAQLTLLDKSLLIDQKLISLSTETFESYIFPFISEVESVLEQLVVKHAATASPELRGAMEKTLSGLWYFTKELDAVHPYASNTALLPSAFPLVPFSKTVKALAPLAGCVRSDVVSLAHLEYFTRLLITAIFPGTLTPDDSPFVADLIKPATKLWEQVHPFFNLSDAQAQALACLQTSEHELQTDFSEPMLPTNTVFVIDSATRQTMCEAFASLKLLDKDKVDPEKLSALAAYVRQHLAQLVESNEQSDASLARKALFVMLKRKRKFASRQDVFDDDSDTDSIDDEDVLGDIKASYRRLVLEGNDKFYPYEEYVSLLNEHRLISELSFVVAQGTPLPSALVDELRSFVEHGVNLTLRSTSLLSPYLALAWKAQSAADAFAHEVVTRSLVEMQCGHFMTQIDPALGTLPPYLQDFIGTDDSRMSFLNYFWFDSSLSLIFAADMMYAFFFVVVVVGGGGGGLVLVLVLVLV